MAIMSNIRQHLAISGNIWQYLAAFVNIEAWIMHCIYLHANRKSITSSVTTTWCLLILSGEDLCLCLKGPCDMISKN